MNEGGSVGTTHFAVYIDRSVGGVTPYRIGAGTAGARPDLDALNPTRSHQTRSGRFLFLPRGRPVPATGGANGKFTKENNKYITLPSIQPRCIFISVWTGSRMDGAEPVRSSPVRPRDGFGFFLLLSQLLMMEYCKLFMNTPLMWIGFGLPLPRPLEC